MRMRMRDEKDEDEEDMRKSEHFVLTIMTKVAGQASILSMACSASTQTIAVGTELENHAATIHLW